MRHSSIKLQPINSAAGPRLIRFAVGLALAGALATLGCGGGATQSTILPEGPQTTQNMVSPSTVGAPAFEAVIALYQADCARCHGATGTGLLGPDLRSRSQKTTLERITAQITVGGGSMPGFQAQLSAEQIADLATWIKAGLPGL